MKNETKNKSWNDVFNKTEYHYGETPNEFVKNNYLKIKEGGKVLCLGSGEGRNAVFLAKQGYDVYAVDYSHVGLNKTKLLADKNFVNLTLIKADLTDYEIINEKYDAIICIFLHLPPKTRKKLANKIKAALKPNGLFIAEYYDLEQINYNTGGPKNTEMLLSVELLKEEFEGLDFELLEKNKKVLIEGTGHTGEAVVVDIIAKKSRI